MMPSLFIAHGAPLLAIEDNEYTRFLRTLGDQIDRPSSIILFSAHWENNIQRISATETYNTIYDFGGFPDELYKIVYPAKGNPGMTEAIQQAFIQQGIPYRMDDTRGLDHGAWVVLRLLYPNADIPVIAMSVNPSLSPDEQYAIGKALFQLRSQGVLIIGSGGTVHNLAKLRFHHEMAEEWAIQFDDWLEENLVKWDLASLFQYNTLAPQAHLAVPPYGNEHFIPLFYVMGACDHERSARLLHRSYQYGSLSQSVWKFG